MKLETENGRRDAERRRRARRMRRRRRFSNALLGTAAIAALLLGAALAIGGRKAVESSAHEGIAALQNYARAQFAGASVESLRIDIKFKHVHRLHAKRDAAIEGGWLVASNDDFVPAAIGTATAEVTAQVRLIGPESRFVAGELWSLEVRTRGDGHIKGMRRFALYPPSVVGGSAPVVAAKHFELSGLVAPRTFIVNVTLNGDELGQALLVELPSEELLRTRGRRAAPIVQLDARPYWASLVANGEAGPYDNPHIASVVASRKARRDDDDTATAIGLLRAFLDGRLAASEVFVLDETARWLAAAEFWGNTNALHWTRQSFYLDAATARLAPFPAVPLARTATAQEGELVSPRSALGARLLADPELRYRFARELIKIESTPEKPLASGRGGSELLDTLERHQQSALQRIHREAPFTLGVDLAGLAGRAVSLHNIDANNSIWFEASTARGDFLFPRVVSAYARIDDDGPVLDFLNLLPVPVHITTLRHAEDGAPGSPITLASRIRFPIALPPTPVGKTPIPVRVPYRQPNAAAVSNAIRGIARIAGGSEEYTFLARRSVSALVEHPVPTASLDDVLAAHPFLRREPGDLSLHTTPGRYAVEGSLVLPAGMGLVIEAGTELMFQPKAALVASGPLDLFGTPEAPVVLRGDNARMRPRWQGIALLRAGRPSRWENARVFDTTGINRRGWKLPAGITVRSASLEVDSVEMDRSRASRALAIVDGRLSGHELRITDSVGTALWLRGSNVDLEELRIEGAGHVGVDAVDSKVSLRGGELLRIRATALEAGDRSEISASGISIAEVSIAASAKNGAQLFLERSGVRDAAHIPLLAFTDRPELGGGEITATGNEISGERAALAQRGSKILLDGLEAETVDAQIGDLQID